MKFLLGTLTIIALLAAGTGITCYRLNAEPALQAAVAQGDAMAWLRADFHLTDRQFAAIKQLHEAYAPSCAEHCRRIQEETELRDRLRASAGDPAALAAANRDLLTLRHTCETAIAAHVRKVAALMSPDDGRRYLALVLPKIAAFDHLAVPDLQLNHTP
jgi:hypothetical protein